MDLYSVLSVTENASPEEIKAAYKRLAFDNHPDRHQGDKTREARFQELSAAYRVLSDPEKRRRYDDEQKAAHAKVAQAAAPTPPPPAPFAPAWFDQSAPAPVAPPPSPGGKDGFLADLFKVLGVAIAGVAIGAVVHHAVNESGSNWDSSVGRRRGRDGKFRRS